MPKKIIFLSHISEEAGLGTIFKDRLEKDFLALIDVFVSSDARSIPPGDAWLKAVDSNLDGAAALIVLASPASVIRPWITFEAGAGWAKKVPTMLVCHSGMTPAGLPLPLGQLQAFNSTDAARLKAMYSVIAGVLGSATPEAALEPFVSSICTFERAYTEERDILGALRQMHEVAPQIIKFMRNHVPGVQNEISQVPDSILRKIEHSLDKLKQRGLLTWSFGIVGMGFAGPSGSGGGSFGTLLITHVQSVHQALQRSEFG